MEMEPHTATEPEHVSQAGTPSYFFSSSFQQTNSGRTLQSLLSGAFAGTQVNVESLDLGVASAADAASRLVRPEVCVGSSQQQSHGQSRETQQFPNRAAAARGPVTAPSVTRPPVTGTTRSQGHPTRASASKTTVVKNDNPEKTDESATVPITRSRKRRSAEASANSDSPVPPRKRARKPSLKKPPPSQVDSKKPPPAENCTCCICMCDAEPEELASINGCQHRFCFECIEKWAERENTCPLCKIRFTKIDRVQKQRRKKGSKNTKKVKQRDQRSDIVPGAALEGLLANIATRHAFPPHSIARLIFSSTNGFIEFNNGRDNASLGGRTSLRGLQGNRARSAREDSMLSSDDDGDEEHRNFAGFFRAIHGRSVVMGGGGMQVVRPVSFTATHINSRSYASNINDRNAGNGAENPLEIDDDSDEEIEVVQVVRPS